MSRAARAVTPLTDAQRAEAERHHYLCEQTARRYARRYPHVAEGEFISAAFDGLCDAIRGHDESRGVMLASYAPRRVSGACVDELRRRRGGVVRVPRSAGDRYSHWVIPLDFGRTTGPIGSEVSLGGSPTEGGPSLADFVLPPAPGPRPGDAMESDEAFECLIAELGPVERFLFRKVYGPDEWTFQQVADHLGFHPSWAFQIHRAALARVASRAARLGLGGGRSPIVSTPPHRRRGREKPGRRSDVARPTDPAAALGRLAAIVGGTDADDPSGLADMLARLKPRQRRAIELRLGLDGEARPRGEVARLLGMTRPGADYAYKAGLEKLRAMARERGEHEHEHEHESSGRSLAS